MVHIVILHYDLGGAEKRFAGMWLYLQRSGRRDVRLVAPEGLIAKLSEVREFAGMERYLDAARTFPNDDVPALRRLLFEVWRADRHSVFHYVYFSPFLVQRFPSRRTVVSITASVWRVSSAVGLAYYGTAMLVAGHVDFLNATVWEPVNRAMFWRRKSLSVTPNSFVDLDLYRPLPFVEKKDRLCFVGTFILEKQIYRLIEHLPEVDRRLKARGFRPEFRLMGRDHDVPSATELARKLAPEIDVEAFEARNPGDVLAGSKVFFSLQRTSNYPSKSLLEGMAAGNLPIITDVADSRRIAPDSLAYYIPSEFTADHLTEAALSILEMPQAEFEAKTAALREHLRVNFSVDRMASYFLDVYKRLGYTGSR